MSMKLNMHILLDELHNYGPWAKLDHSIQLCLKQARIMNPSDSTFSKEYVYVVDGKILRQLSKDCYEGLNLICIPPFHREELEEQPCNLICIDKKLSLAEIFNQVQEIFERYTLWHQRMIEAILHEEPLQNIFDIGASMLTNPIAMFDASLALIMTAGEIPENYQGTIWEEVLSYGYSPVENLPYTERKKMSEWLRIRKEPFFYKSNPSDPYIQMIAGINIHGKHFGSLGLIDIKNAFTMGQMSLVNHLKDVLELAISKNREFEEFSDEPLYFIERLINGLEVEERVVEYHLKRRNWGLEGCIYLLNFSFPGHILDEKLFRTYVYRIKKLLPRAMIFGYDNSIIAVVRKTDYPHTPESLRELDELLLRIGLKCGISLEFFQFMNLKYAYIQSKIALQEGIKKDPEKWRYYFQDYYIGHILNALARSTSLKCLYHPLVQRLKDYDNQNHTNYVRCLYVYLMNGLNISQTARQLFLHRNTLIYRLRRIAEIMGTEICVGEDHFDLAFSCLIAEYLSSARESA
ncbi:MAG: helix-turn-helix domain-containing protein [Anaerolineales bacterium]